MTITITSLRSTLLTAMAVAVLFFPTVSTEARAADPGQAEKEQEQAKGKDKTMTKTKSGLQYRDVEEGTGEKPETGQTCVVHYTGWLWEDNAKGKKFDSSKDRGVPFYFPVGQRKVIAGWDEGVATMKVGGKRELLIPSNLGYGPKRASRDVIPPECHLVLRGRAAGQI